MGYVRSLQSKVCFLISRPPNSQFSNFSELLRCISEGWHCSTGERNVAMPREKTWQCQEPTETKIYSKPAQKKTSNIQICKLSGFNFFKKSIQRNVAWQPRHQRRYHPCLPSCQVSRRQFTEKPRLRAWPCCRTSSTSAETSLSIQAPHKGTNM